MVCGKYTLYLFIFLIHFDAIRIQNIYKICHQKANKTGRVKTRIKRRKYQQFRQESLTYHRGYIDNYFLKECVFCKYIKNTKKKNINKK